MQQPNDSARRHAGRPRGAKDSKPRAKKSQNDIVVSPVSSDIALHHIQVSWAEYEFLPIGPDFPGDLSTQPFQDPFDKNLSCGLWEEAEAESAVIFDPFDGFAISEAFSCLVEPWLQGSGLRCFL